MTTPTAQHTPGPWFADTENCGGGMSIKTADGTSIGHTAAVRDPSYTEIRTPEAIANARLIAAAPDLLAACKEALELLSHVGGPTCGKLKAAIAKAEGQVQP